MNMAPFVIFAMPRSRTAWLSRFLTYGGWFCEHDFVAREPRLSDIRTALSRYQTGFVDTGLCHGWRMVRAAFPDARFVVIRRPIDEIKASLRGVGVDPDWVDFEAMDARLTEIEQQPGTLCFDFEDLDAKFPVSCIWDHCLGLPWDQEWYDAMATVNVQIDMPKRIELLKRNASAYQRLREMVGAFNPA